MLIICQSNTNFTEIQIKIQNFSFLKMHVKMSSANWQPFCPGGDQLKGAPGAYHATTTKPGAYPMEYTVYDNILHRIKTLQYTVYDIIHHRIKTLHMTRPLYKYLLLVYDNKLTLVAFWLWFIGRISCIHRNVVQKINRLDLLWQEISSVAFANYQLVMSFLWILLKWDWWIVRQKQTRTIRTPAFWG